MNTTQRQADEIVTALCDELGVDPGELVDTMHRYHLVNMAFDQCVAEEVERRCGPSQSMTAHQPRRDSDVAAWLRAHRERHDYSAGNGFNAWSAIDEVLDDYRLHSDTGTPLTEPSGTGVPDETCGCGTPRP